MKFMSMMKYGFVSVLFLALALLFMNGSIPSKYLLAGNGGKEQRQRSSPTDTQAVWISFVHASRLSLDSNDRRIVAFKEKIEEAGPKAILEFRRRADDLDQRNTELKQQLEAYIRQRNTEQERFRNSFLRRLDSMELRMQRVLKGNG